MAYAYTVNEGDSTVSVVDLSTNTVAATLTMPSSPAQGAPYVPQLVASSDGSTVYVECDGYITIISGTSILNSIACSGLNQSPLLISADDAYVYGFAADGSNLTIFRLNTATQSLDTAFSITGVGQTPSAAAVSPDGGKIYISQGPAQKIWIVDTSTGASLAVSSSIYTFTGMGFTTDGTQLIVSGYNGPFAGLESLDVSTNSISTLYNAGGQYIASGMLINGSTAYMIDLVDEVVFVIDISTGTLTTTISLSGLYFIEYSAAAPIMVSSDNAYLWVCSNQYQGAWRYLNVFSTRTGNLVHAFNLGSSSGDIMSICFSPDGTKAFYTSKSGFDSLTVVNTSTYSTIATISVGNNPNAILLTYPVPKSLTAHLEDSFTTSGALSRSQEVERALDMTFSFSESAVKSATFGRALNATLSTLDSLQRQIAFARSFADTILESDALALLEGTYHLAEYLITSEYLSRSVVYYRAASDTLASSDALTSGVYYYNPPFMLGLSVQEQMSLSLSVEESQQLGLSQ